jgi:hypothetical protein
MQAIENFCCALAIFGLAVAAGWWWIGQSGPQVSGVMVVEAGHE